MWKGYFYFVFLIVLFIVFFSNHSILSAEEVSSRKSLLEELLRNNPALISARGQLKVAEARLHQAERYPYNPTLEIGGEADTIDFKNGENRLEALISQEIEIGGKRRIRTDIARSELEETRFNYNNQVRLIEAKFEKTFETYLYQQEKVRLSQEFVDLEETLLDLAGTRLKNGDIAEIDVNLAQVEAEKSRNQLNNATLELSTIAGQINGLLARRGDKPLAINDRLSQSSFTGLLPDLLRQADQNRSDLLELRQAQKTARVKIKEEKRKRIPLLTGTLGFIKEQRTFPFLSGAEGIENKSLLAARLSIPLPLINQNQGGIEQAVAAENVQSSRVNELTLSVQLEVTTLFQQLKNSELILQRFNQTILSLSKDNLTRLQEAFREGQMDISTLIAQQDRYVQIQSTYLETLLNYNLVRIDLLSASGQSLQ